ncbi:MIZ/SP-RING zinc finger domain-containing protein [Besnoitia besnoiti]|uniref:MIZ/SP-RING zinc finger domain-containing protein n=1 Tax=Besnoitia besnoiti TaxID=94643 RepID=A0A2A9LXX5_BESBE|nr:MIZ/SP-RING zinc finger domain-containing protein [Besnoitia besnoiti]PFH31328.1 MIZ/SP-RING zinc finger domain-containing protein [Besnoitia besnoiti]
MCRELGLPHSGRRKQVLVQALYDYQRSNGGIPTQLVTRFAGRHAQNSAAARGFSQHVQHAAQALPAHHGQPPGHHYIPPYSSSANYSHDSSLNLYPSSSHRGGHSASSSNPHGRANQPLLAGSAAEGLAAPTAPPPATFANRGFHGATVNGALHAGSTQAADGRTAFASLVHQGGAPQDAEFGGASAATPGTGLYAKCLCRGAAGNAGPRKGHTAAALKCSTCGGWNHPGCYPAECNTQSFVCSMCRMKRLDPFYPVAEVLWEARLELSHYAFELNAQNLRKWRAEGKEVIVRCMQVDLQPLYQTWPKSINITVNGRTEETVAAPSWEHKRRDTPIPITQYLKTSRNRIEFTWTNYDEPQQFHLAVLLCESKTPDALANQVWQQGQVAEADAEKRVLDIIGNRSGKDSAQSSADDSDDDDVMCLEVTRRIKLLCPVTFTRIEVPCRGRACRHLQCYDLAGYLLVTKNTKAFNTRWKCPECHLYVRPDELVVDGFVQKVLSNTDEEATVVELEPDASFRVVTEKELKEESKRAEEQRQLASNAGMRGLKDGGRQASPEGETNLSRDGPAKKAFEVVEMLSDSDDEADETANGDAGEAPPPAVSDATGAPETETDLASGAQAAEQAKARLPKPPVAYEGSGAPPSMTVESGDRQKENALANGPTDGHATSRERPRVDDEDCLPPQPKRPRRVVTSPCSSPRPKDVPCAPLSDAPPMAGEGGAAARPPAPPSACGCTGAGASSSVPASSPAPPPGAAAAVAQQPCPLPPPSPLPPTLQGARGEEPDIFVVLSSDEEDDFPALPAGVQAASGAGASRATSDQDRAGERPREDGADAGRRALLACDPKKSGKGGGRRQTMLRFKQKQELPSSDSSPAPALSSSGFTLPGGAAAADAAAAFASLAPQGGTFSPFSGALGQGAATSHYASPVPQSVPDHVGLPAISGAPLQHSLNFSSLAGAAADNPISVIDSSDGEDEEEEAGDDAAGEPQHQPEAASPCAESVTQQEPLGSGNPPQEKESQPATAAADAGTRASRDQVGATPSSIRMRSAQSANSSDPHRAAAARSLAVPRVSSSSSFSSSSAAAHSSAELARGAASEYSPGARGARGTDAEGARTDGENPPATLQPWLCAPPGAAPAATDSPEHERAHAPAPRQAEGASDPAPVEAFRSGGAEAERGSLSDYSKSRAGGAGDAPQVSAQTTVKRARAPVVPPPLFVTSRPPAKSGEGRGARISSAGLEVAPPASRDPRDGQHATGAGGRASEAAPLPPAAPAQAASASVSTGARANHAVCSSVPAVPHGVAASGGAPEPGGTQLNLCEASTGSAGPLLASSGSASGLQAPALHAPAAVRLGTRQDLCQAPGQEPLVQGAFNESSGATANVASPLSSFRPASAAEGASTDPGMLVSALPPAGSPAAAARATVSARAPYSEPGAPVAQVGPEAVAAGPAAAACPAAPVVPGSAAVSGGQQAPQPHWAFHVSLPSSSSEGAPFLLPSVQRHGSGSQGGPGEARDSGAGGPRVGTAQQQQEIELHRQRLQRKSEEDLQLLLSQQEAAAGFAPMPRTVLSGLHRAQLGASASSALPAGLAFLPAGGAGAADCYQAPQGEEEDGSCDAYGAADLFGRSFFSPPPPCVFARAAAPHGMPAFGTPGTRRQRPAGDAQESGAGEFAQVSEGASESDVSASARAGVPTEHALNWTEFHSVLNAEAEDQRTQQTLSALFGPSKPSDPAAASALAPSCVASWAPGQRPGRRSPFVPENALAARPRLGGRPHSLHSAEGLSAERLGGEGGASGASGAVSSRNGEIGGSLWPRRDEGARGQFASYLHQQSS